jgi:hypothetical protein
LKFWALAQPYSPIPQHASNTRTHTVLGCRLNRFRCAKPNSKNANAASELRGKNAETARE